MMEEYAAGTYLADAIDLSTAGLRPMLEAGLLQSYTSPELQKVRKDAIEPGGHWVIGCESSLSLGYNTQLVAEAEAPRTPDDLLDPKWQGKFAVPGTTTLTNWIGALVLDKGEDFVRQLGRQKIRIYQVSARAVANFVVSSEVALSPALYNSHIANSRARGANVAWRHWAEYFRRPAAWHSRPKRRIRTQRSCLLISSSRGKASRSIRSSDMPRRGPTSQIQKSRPRSTISPIGRAIFRIMKSGPCSGDRCSVSDIRA
jgi:hypothetical protein